MPVSMFANLLEMKAEFQHLLDAWQECFETAAHVSFHDGCWYRFTDGDELNVSNEPESDAVCEVLDDAQCCGRPAIRSNANQHLVAISLQRSNCGHIAVWGEYASADPGSVRRLACATQAIAFRERELKDANERAREFVQQVTADFEELTWLRSLAEYLDVCDVHNAVEAVAHTVLPTLRDLIQAECMAFIHPLQTTYAPIIYGESPLRCEDYAALVRELTADFADGPVVKNWKRPEIYRADRLRNCILIPITKGTEEFGYIAAINKMPAESISIDSGYLAHEDFSELEFGTFEAGLVNAAAVTLATHARNVQLFREQEGLLIGIVRALINAIDAKDAYTCGHSDRVALIGRRLAQQLSLNDLECERIYMAGLLHDIGKIGVPDDVLKKPGKLTSEEFDAIKKHPEIGYSILHHLPQLRFVLPGVLHHHEAIDGSGYPHGLKGDNIPLAGRILAVADAYDAMTSCRPYRTAMPLERAEDILRSGAGQQWDAQVIDAFFAAKSDILRISDYRPESRLALLKADTVQIGNVTSDVRDAITSAVTRLQSL